MDLTFVGLCQLPQIVQCGFTDIRDALQDIFVAVVAVDTNQDSREQG